MSNKIYKNEKVFDRSVCFMFFNDYRSTARSIEEAFGESEALRYYNAAADYALFAVEPELSGALGLVWPTTKASIDASINRRKSYFSKEDTGMTQKVKDYSVEHPDATQREIADAVGCSVGKVNKSLNKDKNVPDCDGDSGSDFATESDSPSHTSDEHERERSRSSLEKREEKRGKREGVNKENWGKRSLTDLSSEELDGALAMFKTNEDWAVIRAKYGLPVVDECGDWVISRAFENDVREAKKVALDREQVSIGETALKDAEAKPELSEHLASRLGITTDEFLSIVPTLGHPFDTIQWLIEDVCSDSAQLSHGFWEENLTGLHSTYQKYLAAYFTDDYSSISSVFATKGAQDSCSPDLIQATISS